MVPDEVLAPPRSTPQFIDLLATTIDPRAELTEALLQPHAFIPPKYFYDSLGSRLFEAICELPEYPLMRTERAIVDAHVHEIAARIGPGSVLIDRAPATAKGRAFVRLACADAIRCDRYRRRFFA